MTMSDTNEQLLFKAATAHHHVGELAQAQEIANTKPDAGPFLKPADKFPASISASEQQRLRSAMVDALNHDVMPAYRKLADFLRDEYAPHGRTDSGVWSLPDGEARYRFAIRRMTTTDMTPDQIHELGLKQVDEFEAEMLAVAHQLGFKDLASLNDHIKNDRKFYATYAPKDIGTPFPWSQGPRRIGIDRQLGIIWVADSWGGNLVRIDQK